MRRLPPDKLSLFEYVITDEPENCSALFLMKQKSSMVLVDNLLHPKLASISYPQAPPPMSFVYGTTDQRIILQRFLKSISEPADLVIPVKMLPYVNRFWPIEFLIPVLFLAADERDWRPNPVSNTCVRMLKAEDASVLAQTFSDHSWLWEFFITPEGLLTRGQAAAAFIDGQMASIAATLAYTEKYCEIGIATRQEYRGRGLAQECSSMLTRVQYEGFGRLPVWRTHQGNVASWKIARDLGLKETKHSEEFIFVSNYKHEGERAKVAP